MLDCVGLLYKVAVFAVEKRRWWRLNCRSRTSDAPGPSSRKSWRFRIYRIFLTFFYVYVNWYYGIIELNNRCKWTENDAGTCTKYCTRYVLGMYRTSIFSTMVDKQQNLFTVSMQFCRCICLYAAERFSSEVFFFVTTVYQSFTVL